MPISVAEIRNEFMPGLVVRAYERYSFGYSDWSSVFGSAVGVVRDLAADKRSVELLKAWLSPDQLERFNQDGKFAVVGSKSKNKYWITDGGTSHNVVRINPKTNRSAERLCFVPVDASARGDVMLAQKIMLETDEPQALKIANRYAVTAEA
jgi:hypothetical protein